MDRVKQVKGVALHTSLDPKWGCAIGMLSVAGKTPNELDSFLLSKYKIHAVAINWENIKGLRVTPNLYTTTANLDLLVKGIEEFAKS